MFVQITFVTVVGFNAWTWMQAVHEIGHVVAAWLSGGHVTCLVWHIASISRTDVMPNPHPLFVCWSGPIAGCLLPCLAACAAGCTSRTDASAANEILIEDAALSQCVTSSIVGQLHFFAGFCLLANGAYLSVGSIDRVGDAGDLLKLGSPHWTLWAVGCVAAVAGFYVWHRLGQPRDLLKLHVRRKDLLLNFALMFLAFILQATAFARQ